MVFAGATSILAKYGLENINFDLGPGIRTTTIFVLVTGFVIATSKYKDLPLLTAKQMTLLIMSGITTTLSWVFYYRAMKDGLVSYVAAIDKGHLNYTRPINKRFAWTVGLLYHHNFKFPDDYWWGLGGIVYTEQLGKKITLTAAGLVEKKFGHGRAFVDGSATLEYRFIENWNTQFSVHRYENQGQFDVSPTQKLELEFGVNRLLKHKQFVGVSFFRHIQYGAPNDQFSFLKFKYGISF